ncbi:ABC transporter substrate-binding protein [Paenibacillus sp. MBLB4367]|uniref:ABC transporter substrate-binding protein n=1 Tax=Paenibacillus sp. MBLB4367 TaxID=3384767 RepID=UPI00390830E3
MATRYRSKRFTIGALLAGLVLAVGLTGCGNGTGNAAETAAKGQASPQPDKKLEKVKYAAFNGVSGLAVRFGAEKGFFKEEGIDVEFISTSDPVAGLTSKEIDIADVNTTAAIVAGGKGAPIKIVSSMFRTKGPFYLVAKPGINSIAELKGKKVGAAAFGSGLDAYTKVILKANGLGANDVTFIANGANEAAYASLESGQVDATIIHEPFASLAEKNGKGKLLAKGWDYLPTFHTGVLASNTTFIDKHPELVEKLLRAYFKSQDYAKNHLDEYKQYFLKNVKIDADVFDKAFEREKVLWENNPNVDVNALNDTQKTQKELGFQDQIYDVNKLLDLRFIPKK